MKKIGLLGAPGAGKTRFADELGTYLIAQGHDKTRVAVVDNVHLDMEESFDLGTGIFASHFVDIHMSLARFGHERAMALSEPDYLITCGTLIDSCTYTALNCTLDGGEYAWAVATVVMPYYSLLSMTHLDYDVLTYLPLPEGSDDFAHEIDKNLLSIAKEFGREIIENPSIAEIHTALKGSE